VRLRAPGFGLLACVGVWACVPAAAPSPVGPTQADAPVLVYYPAGECAGELEVEIYDRGSGAWVPHAEHPRLPPGACRSERSGQLFNELRVRCADPAGRRAPSAWVVGAEVGPTSAACADAQSR